MIKFMVLALALGAPKYGQYPADGERPRPTQVQTRAEVLQQLSAGLANVHKYLDNLVVNNWLNRADVDVILQILDGRHKCTKPGWKVGSKKLRVCGVQDYTFQMDGVDGVLVQLWMQLPQDIEWGELNVCVGCNDWGMCLQQYWACVAVFGYTLDMKTFRKLPLHGDPREQCEACKGNKVDELLTVNRCEVPLPLPNVARLDRFKSEKVYLIEMLWHPTSDLISREDFKAHARKTLQATAMWYEPSSGAKDTSQLEPVMEHSHYVSPEPTPPEETKPNAPEIIRTPAASTEGVKKLVPVVKPKAEVKK